MTEAAATIFVGTRVVLRGVFTPAGSAVATDPTAVAAKIRKPDGTKFSKVSGVDSEIMKISTGVYELRWVPDAAGVWYFGFTGTIGTTPIVVEEVAIRVRKAAATA